MPESKNHLTGGAGSFGQVASVSLILSSNSDVTFETVSFISTDFDFLLLKTIVYCIYAEFLFRLLMYLQN